MSQVGESLDLLYDEIQERTQLPAPKVLVQTLRRIDMLVALDQVPENGKPRKANSRPLFTSRAKVIDFAIAFLFEHLDGQIESTLSGWENLRVHPKDNAFQSGSE